MSQKTQDLEIIKKRELLEFLNEARDRNYNPFEPDNQSDRYHKIERLISSAQRELYRAQRGLSLK